MAIHAILAEHQILRIGAVLTEKRAIGIFACHIFVTKLAFVAIYQVYASSAVIGRITIRTILVVIANEYQVAIFVESGAVGVIAVDVLEHEGVLSRNFQL